MQTSARTQRILTIVVACSVAGGWACGTTPRQRREHAPAIVDSTATPHADAAFDPPGDAGVESTFDYVLTNEETLAWRIGSRGTITRVLRQPVGARGAQRFVSERLDGNAPGAELSIRYAGANNCVRGPQSVLCVDTFAPRAHVVIPWQSQREPISVPCLGVYRAAPRGRLELVDDWTSMCRLPPETARALEQHTAQAVVRFGGRGGEHQLCMLDSGALRCFALPLGERTTMSPVELPRQLRAIGPFRSLVAGDTHACVVTERDAALWCWGLRRTNSLRGREIAFPPVRLASGVLEVFSESVRVVFRTSTDAFVWNAGPYVESLTVLEPFRPHACRLTNMSGFEKIKMKRSAICGVRRATHRLECSLTFSVANDGCVADELLVVD